MYEEEKKSIMDVYEQEKLLYGDDFGLVSESINYIDHEIEIWKKKFDRTVQNVTSVTHDPDAPPQHPFYFYQTGFNSGNTYILSPFDLKLLKTTYKNYFSFPSVLLAKMESIHYDELNEQNVHTKFKYLSHLPIGTQIGFIECDWSNNELINKETWEMFKEDLLKRTKNSKRKFKKEERDKKRAMNEEEVKTRNFYMRENGHDQGEEEGHESTFGMGSLSILDNRELPALSDHQHSTESEREYETTVWGTRIPKGEAAPGSSSAIADEEDNEYEEMIRKAKEEMAKQEQNGKRKKKKKLVLISS
ncbi:MAG2 RING-finger protein MAG2 [Candida maltosa Xu316]